MRLTEAKIEPSRCGGVADGVEGGLAARARLIALLSEPQFLWLS